MKRLDKKRILALSSGGGHWVELLRLRPAFAGHEVTFATVDAHYQADVPDARFYVIPDATQARKVLSLWCAIRILVLLWRVRPHVVISTGSAPGYIAVRLASWLGARTLWLDSLANVDCLSVAGQRIGKHADLWLTQWAHLAREDGPQCHGLVV